MASETPASSLTQTATSSTSTSGSSNNPTLFAPGSFPPIIVGFLGLGLVTAVIIALSGYRRFRRGRRGPPPGGPPGGSTGVGDRPKLWDLWTEGNVGGKASFWDHGSWENITVRRLAATGQGHHKLICFINISARFCYDHCRVWRDQLFTSTTQS